MVLALLAPTLTALSFINTITFKFEMYFNKYPSSHPEMCVAIELWTPSEYWINCVNSLYPPNFQMAEYSYIMVNTTKFVAVDNLTCISIWNDDI